MGLYFNVYPDRIFKDAEVLIYVFDVNYMGEEDMKQFQKIVDYLIQFSPNAKVFVLVHKMDMVLNKEEKFNEAQLKIKECPQSKYVRECFATTIWDVTLYNAWSKIVQI